MSTASTHGGCVRVHRAAAAKLVSLVLLALITAGCARQNRLASVWRDPAFEAGSLRRLMVVAVGRMPRERRVYEDALVASLRSRGVDAMPSYPAVGDQRVETARVDTAMHAMGCDAILVSRVVDRQTVRRYYPPIAYGYGFGHSYYGVPGAYHGGWWPYYSLGYAYGASPGYTVVNQRIRMESNLYRQADDRLVWSGLSQEWVSESDPPDVEVAPMVREIAVELARSGVVATQSGTISFTRSPR